MKKVLIMLLMMAPMATFAQKFGHVDVQAIMTSLPEYTRAEGELKAKAQEFENELKGMQDEIQRKYDEYEKTKSTMNQTKQQETEKNINDLMQKYQQAQQDNSQAFQKLQQEKLAPIQQKVFQAVENVGKNGGYVYIMQAQSLPYISSTLSKDVTADVKAEIQKLK